MEVPLTITDFLERAAFVAPGRTAVVDEPSATASLGSITYEELDQRARGMAAALDDLGVPQGGRVGIVSPNSARFLIAFFGVSGFGRVLVPINFRSTPPRSATSSSTREATSSSWIRRWMPHFRGWALGSASFSTARWLTGSSSLR